MSDDEEYYEWEEEYLYEDLVPDFVDELAQSSYYEAALYEDPAIDVEDYFSDWEYYSDDYYDDDPSVKQSIPNPPPTKKARRALAQAQTNSQTHANRVTRPKSSMDPDISSFQGVVWKTPALDINQDVAIFYEPIGDKVALLKDWREIFKSAQPALNKSRLRKRKMREDEAEEQGEGENVAVEVSFADDDFPCDDDDDERRLDSSEQMSDIVSMDNSMTDTADAGDASNTTPELGQSPKPAPTSTPAKRGRKRKAEVPADEIKNSEIDSTRTRSKRVAAKKGDGEDNLVSTTSAPTRRSTRQKK